MFIKLIFLCAFTIAIEALPSYHTDDKSEEYNYLSNHYHVQPKEDHKVQNKKADNKHEDKIIDYHGPAKYEFSYGVEDHKTGDYKSHHEMRDGDEVKGEYTVLDPNGKLRTVKYTANKHTGFQAVVSHSGQDDPNQFKDGNTIVYSGYKFDNNKKEKHQGIDNHAKKETIKQKKEEIYKYGHTSDEQYHSIEKPKKLNIPKGYHIPDYHMRDSKIVLHKNEENDLKFSYHNEKKPNQKVTLTKIPTHNLEDSKKSPQYKKESSFKYNHQTGKDIKMHDQNEQTSHYKFDDKKSHYKSKAQTSQENNKLKSSNSEQTKTEHNRPKFDFSNFHKIETYPEINYHQQNYKKIEIPKTHYDLVSPVHQIKKETHKTNEKKLHNTKSYKQTIPKVKLSKESNNKIKSNIHVPNVKPEFDFSDFYKSEKQPEYTYNIEIPNSYSNLIKPVQLSLPKDYPGVQQYEVLYNNEPNQTPTQSNIKQIETPETYKSLIETKKIPLSINDNQQQTGPLQFNQNVVSEEKPNVFIQYDVENKQNAPALNYDVPQNYMFPKYYESNDDAGIEKINANKISPYFVQPKPEIDGLYEDIQKLIAQYSNQQQNTGSYGFVPINYNLSDQKQDTKSVNAKYSNINNNQFIDTPEKKENIDNQHVVSVSSNLFQDNKGFETAYLNAYKQYLSSQNNE